MPAISTPVPEAAILARILRMRDPSRANQILADHGSLGRVLAKARRDDGSLRGVSEPEAETLAYVAEALTRVTLNDMRAEPFSMQSWDRIVLWARSEFANSAIEAFAVLTLDRKNALIRARVIASGTVDHAPVYPREIAKLALADDASAVILVHNHPSGDPKPSRADIDMTRDVAKACAVLGIAVHDHIVIGAQTHASLRALGLM